MQLVIEISKADYEYFKNTSFVEHEDCLRQSPEDRRGTLALFRLVDGLKSGIVLPKWHGDLIDRSKLEIADVSPEPWYSPMWAYSEWMIDDAEVVIPADKDGD